MVRDFISSDLKKLYVPQADSHKGQNGKLLLIGGSTLFHAASLWSLEIASRIVDMVFYSSVPENNEIVYEAKKKFRNGIVVPRKDIESYIEEADCVLIGPGMVRTENSKLNDQNAKSQLKIQNVRELIEFDDEGVQTYLITKYLLEKYPEKKWVIDGGALQMMDPEWLRKMPEVILTPHKREFEMLINKSQKLTIKDSTQKLQVEEIVYEFAKEYSCIVLLKGQEDIICSGFEATPRGCKRISGGNAGMTKGGTGDVLAGLVAALACKNDLFLAASAGSYINKKAGESLYGSVGPFFNASDLVLEIPKVMKKYLV